MSLRSLLYLILGKIVEKLSRGKVVLIPSFKDMTPNQRAIEYGWVLVNLPRIGGMKILDVGTDHSPFPFLARRSGYDVTPIDRENLPNVMKIDGTDLPWSNETYDAVTSISVIEHVPPPDDRKMLDEIWRVLKPTGYLFLTTEFQPVKKGTRMGRRVFMMNDLGKLLHSFTIVETTFFRSIDKEGNRTAARLVRNKNDADGIMILAKPDK